MKKISFLLALIMIFCTLYVVSAQADGDGVVQKVIRAIKTRGSSTSTTTTTPAPCAVRG